MTIEIVDGDILDITEGIIVHQVNCQGVMGSGVAGAIRGKYPEVYDAYKEFTFGKRPQLLLGLAQPVRVSSSLTIFNLFGQQSYGPGDRLYTQYGAVRSGFKELYKWLASYDAPVFVPYLMGCALAGGDWDIYSQIVEEEIGEFTAIRKL